MSNQPVPTSNDSFQEDWDGSPEIKVDGSSQATESLLQSDPTDLGTPCNSVVFPVVKGDNEMTPSRALVYQRSGTGQGKRTLSELLSLHAEKGTDCQLSQEEAARLGDVLGQWINASSSPYEGEDEFFKYHDDINLPSKVPITSLRPRGQSECMGSHPASVTRFSMA